MPDMVQRPYEVAEGHQFPFAVQFSVFLANRVGQFKELLDIFADEDLTVLGVSVIDSTDWAVVRLVFSDPEKARAVFHRHRIAYTDSRVLLAVLQTDQTLSLICEILLQAEINVHFAFPLTVRHADCPVMVFHVDDTIVGTQVLSRHQLLLLGEEDLLDTE